MSRKKILQESHIITALLTKVVRSRWLDIGLVLFFCLWTSTPSRVEVHKQTKKHLTERAWSITHTSSSLVISCVSHSVSEDEFTAVPFVGSGTNNQVQQLITQHIYLLSKSTVQGCFFIFMFSAG